MEEDTFNWGHSIQWMTGPEDVLRLGTTEVLRLSQNVQTLAWFVTLDQHLDWDFRKNRPCASYEQGRAGAMIWALRHEERIRREVAERAARRKWGH